MSRDPRQLLARGAAAAALAGACGLGLSGLGWARAPEAAFFGWFLAAVFWTGAALGACAWLMLHHLTGGRWGWAARPGFEAAGLTLPLLGLLFLLPLALGGLEALFPFARLEPGEGGRILEHRRPYLDRGFYLARNAGFFALWSAGGVLLARRRRWQSSLAGPGLVLLVLTVTFSAYDWIAALHPHWYSTIVGLYLLAGQALTAVALVALGACLLPPPLGTRPEEEGRRLDLGNLLLVALVLYTYAAFSQWLITWSGDLPHETSFYLPRTQGGWRVVVWALVAAHFSLPFFALLSRAVKRDRRSLAAVAGLVLAARVMADAWMVLPASDAGALALLGCSLSALLGVGGAWLACLALLWRRRWEADAPREVPA